MKLAEQTEEFWIEKARLIATSAHEGQKRRNGQPYIEHPARVASAVESRLQAIAWLHDTIEDTGVTSDDLRKEGFPSYIVDAVKILTHVSHEPNMVYWKRILTSKDAVTIKIADIKDNLASNPSDHAREKYAVALELFKNSGYSV